MRLSIHYHVKSCTSATGDQQNVKRQRCRTTASDMVIAYPALIDPTKLVRHMAQPFRTLAICQIGRQVCKELTWVHTLFPIASRTSSKLVSNLRYLAVENLVDRKTYARALESKSFSKKSLSLIGLPHAKITDDSR
jgi:hypothetical protein